MSLKCDHFCFVNVDSCRTQFQMLGISFSAPTFCKFSRAKATILPNSQPSSMEIFKMSICSKVHVLHQKMMEGPGRMDDCHFLWVNNSLMNVHFTKSEACHKHPPCNSMSSSTNKSVTLSISFSIGVLG